MAPHCSSRFQEKPLTLLWWENEHPLLTCQDFVLLSPHMAELQWQGTCNLALVFRLHLSKQLICIHSLTLDYTWHFKSIMFEKVLSVICKIGVAECAGFPKIARQRSFLSTCFFSSLLAHTSISSDGCSTRGLSRAVQQTPAPIILKCYTVVQQPWLGPPSLCTTRTCAKDTVSALGSSG